MWLFRRHLQKGTPEAFGPLSTSNRVNMSALAPKSLNSPARPVEEIPTKV